MLKKDSVGGNRENRLSGLLVRGRWWLATLLAVLAVVSAILVPRTRLNADVTRYLPDDSQMRRGLSILEEDFPGMDIRLQTLRVLFYEEAPSDTLQLAIESLLSGERMIEVRRDGKQTLYQYYLPREADGAAVRQQVQARFGGRARVELEDNTGMPEGVPLMIGTGFALIFLILLVMCPSLVEVLLFMLTFGIAILINMGTNALLPSVSLITNALAAVMQLALSIDYAIILMNRYRQEKRPEVTNEQAMASAVKLATPSILSSAFTTVVSLMMLCFMRLKIGADLGVVLSKGVLCSLVTTFALLPALILACDKAIVATQKRVPKIPTGGLARFEWRFRVPLALLFVALLVGAWFLKQQTEMYYSMTRLTPITRAFPERNRMLLLYPTAEEEAVIPLVDSLSLTPGVSCISYPSIAMKPRTASDLVALAPDLTEHVPTEVIDLLYYAATHPERTERMRLDQLEPTARSLAALAQRLAPDASFSALDSRFDLSGLFPPPAPTVTPGLTPGSTPSVTPGLTPPVTPGLTGGLDTTDVASPDSTGARSVPGMTAKESAVGGDQTGTPSVTPGLTRGPDTSAVVPNILDRMGLDYSYGQLTLPRTAAEMAAYLPVEPRYIRIVYRLAGAGRKGRPETLTASEFMDTVSEKVLQDKRYSALIPKESAATLAEVQQIVDDVMAKGPSAETVAPADTVAAVMPPADTLLVAPVVLPSEDSASVTPSVPPAQQTQAEAAPYEELTPLEELAELALSGRSCTAAQCYRALRRAGISVQREEIDLLYLYHGYQTSCDTTSCLSLLELEDYLAGLLERPLVRQYLDSARTAQLGQIRETINGQLGSLRGSQWSLAVITSDLPEEAPETFAFIDGLTQRCDDSFAGDTYRIGYSVMYHEMKAGFPRELLVLTLLTFIAIFVIVALTFRSPVIPFVLVSTVLTAVWLDVTITGLMGSALLYLSYLVLQSVLMGATIDYSILFTHYYRFARDTQDPPASLATAYQGSIHTICTSGSILVLGTWIMSQVISDPIIVPVIRSISLGALIAVVLILFLLPAVLALLDRWVRNRNK